MHKTTIPKTKKTSIFRELKKANLEFQKKYPGDHPDRQPVHTVYGGAHLFKFDSAVSLGQLALKNLETYAADFGTFGKIFHLPGSESIPDKKKERIKLLKKLDKMSDKDRKSHPAGLSYDVYLKVRNKLQTEAVEDFRIDFEDGYGNRPDEEEDQAAVSSALEVAKGMKSESLPPFIGIRIKPFTEDLRERSIRTLDLFLTSLLTESNSKLPDNFIVMLPKVTITPQIEALVSFFEIIEEKFKMAAGSLRLEIMVETTQSIMDDQGVNPLKRFVAAAKGRMRGTHFGTYDYTASCNITAKYQTMDHPVCDFAHHMTKVALAHTGIELSDGATNVMPVGPHKGPGLSKKQEKENRQTVHRAWIQAYFHIRHSLWNGYYQGWDLHPAQFPARYAAVYAFFLESLDEATKRLRTFMERAARATLIGDIFDDAATGQGLLNYFLRALNCGAITENEILATGLSMKEIRTRSFLKILQGRKSKSKK